MDQIISDTPSVSKLFGDTRYNIDYYQREYRWERRQVAQLLDDLFGSFGESHEPGNVRTDVEKYGQYFLGPVILTQREGVTDIVDGQQRLTTLTLLLIALYHRIDDSDQRTTISSLIMTTRMGERTFTLAVPERAQCMEVLYTGKMPVPETSDPSVRNIIDRFADIEELLDGGLDPAALPFFADWLMYRVMMVSVSATTEQDAYTIFETMNDRGLRLTLPEMLRGYLLSRIESPADRSTASDIWKERVADLAELGKEEDVDAIQAWLRGRRAETTSRYVAGVAPGDYERIGNEFHRWVRDVEETRLGLIAPSDFGDFIHKDFDFYVGWYARLRRAAESHTESLETVQYIASQGFTAPLRDLPGSLAHGRQRAHSATQDSRDCRLRRHPHPSAALEQHADWPDLSSLSTL